LAYIQKVKNAKVDYLVSFDDYYNPRIADLILAQIDRLLPEPLVKVEIKAKVEMVAVRQQHDLIIRNIQISVKLNHNSCRVIEAASGKIISAANKDGYLNFTVPELEIMESIRLQGYFS